MIEFINNPWTIGIGGGLISGLIVFLISSKIFSKRENKEINQKINMANKELLYSIRPLIVQKKLPTNEIMDSLIFSTAKKYGLKYEDLYNNEDIADDLIKETLENPFISSESKLEYCQLANDLKSIGLEEEDFEDIKREIVYVDKEKSISKEFFSITLAMITTLSVVITTVFFFRDKNSLNNIISDNFPIDSSLILITISLTLIPIISLTMSKLLKLMKEKEYMSKINEKLDSEKDEKKELEKIIKDK